jgi:hypothetical protein
MPGLYTICDFPPIRELDDGTTIYVDSEAERVQLLNDQLAAVLVAMAHYCHGKVGCVSHVGPC